jgi:NADH dehydrogenase/NADH:ubiquinone oxidoreductase subunit G
MPDRVSVTAEPGESLLAVANRCGVAIPTSCFRGACHACKLAIEGQSHPVLACIAKVPTNDLSIFHRYPAPSTGESGVANNN